MDYFHNRHGTLLRGAVLFTLVLTGGCLSGGGGGGSGGGSSGGGSGNGSTVTLSSGSSSLIPVIISPTPTVERVNPQATSTGAVITAIVLALFDREMDAATINSSTFTLTGPGGDVDRGLGRSIEVVQFNAAELLEAALLEIDGQGFAAADHAGEAAGAVRRAVLQEGAEHGGHEVHHGHARALDGLQDGVIDRQAVQLKLDSLGVGAASQPQADPTGDA